MKTKKTTNTFKRPFDLLVIWLFSFVWHFRLLRTVKNDYGWDYKVKMKVVGVKGFRTALVEHNMYSRETVTFMIKVFKWHI